MDERALVLAIGEPRQYQADQVIFREGEPGDGLFILVMKVLFALCEVLTQRLRETNDRCMSVFTIAQWGAALPQDLLPLP